MIERVVTLGAVTCGLAFLAHRSRSVAPSGLVAGILLAAGFASMDHLGPFMIFAAFAVIGSLSSRLGGAAKRRLGVMQADDGRRDWTHAVANCGPAAAVAVWWHFAGRPPSMHAALLAGAGLGAMLSDTVAGEWGTWLGGEPRSIVTWRTVPIGADGGVTVAGTLAAGVAAVLAAGLHAVGGEFTTRAVASLAVAAFFGNVVDSVLGATVESRLGRRGGALVNALASSAAIGLALLLMRA